MNKEANLCVCVFVGLLVACLFGWFSWFGCLYCCHYSCYCCCCCCCNIQNSKLQSVATVVMSLFHKTHIATVDQKQPDLFVFSCCSGNGMCHLPHGDIKNQNDGVMSHLLIIMIDCGKSTAATTAVTTTAAITSAASSATAVTQQQLKHNSYNTISCSYRSGSSSNINNSSYNSSNNTYSSSCNNIGQQHY